MSRSQAKKTFTQEQLKKSMEGIVARTDKGVLDEIGSSYKDINIVMYSSTDLVRPIHKLVQMMNIKG